MMAAPGSILTIDELSDYLRMPKSTLYKLAQEGGLPCQKIGRHWRFYKEAIDTWLADKSRFNPSRRKHHSDTRHRRKRVA